MSFILDALKKSEAERQRQAGPALLEMHVVRPQRRLPVWLIVVGALLIVVNLAGLLWLLLRPATPASAPAPASAAGAAASRGAPPSTPAAGMDPATQLAPGERLIGPGAGGGLGAAGNGTVPALVGSDDGPVAGDTNPADLLPAEPARAARSGAALRNYADLGNVLPPLRLDLHVYDASPSLRYAFINMKKLREGDTTADGARVLEITRDGVVMDYRRTEFLLTNDSSSTAGSAAPSADSR